MELLVAIGILVILVALIAPVVSKMRESAQSVECLGNLRALGQFGISYSIEHDGNMPQAYVGGPYPYPPPHSAAYWFDTYCAYYGIVAPPGVKLRENLPSTITCSANKGSTKKSKVWAINWGTGYSSTPSDWGNPEPHQWVKYGQIKKYPSGDIVRLDSLSKTAWFADGSGFDFLYARAGQQDQFKRPHNGKSNVLFFDGHVESVNIPDFSKEPSSVLRQQVWIDFFGNKDL